MMDYMTMSHNTSSVNQPPVGGGRRSSHGGRGGGGDMVWEDPAAM